MGAPSDRLAVGAWKEMLAIRTQALIQSNTTAILHYSTMGSDDDIIFGLGVGCNGSVEILVEPSVYRIKLILWNF